MAENIIETHQIVLAKQKSILTTLLYDATAQYFCGGRQVLVSPMLLSPL
jgi:hypothetical protein